MTPRIKMEIVSSNGTATIDLDKNPNQDQFSIATTCLLLLGGAATTELEIKLFVKLISEAAERLALRRFPV